MCENIQNYAVGLTIAGSFLVLALKKYCRLLSLLFVSLGFVLSVLLISPAIRGSVTVYEKYFTDFFSLVLIADPFSVFMAVLSSLLGVLILVYTFGFLDGENYARQNEYYFYVTLFIGSMLGFVFSANLLLMYVFWEMIAVVFWRLTGFYGDNEQLVASDKMFFTTFFGSVLMLAGFGLIYNDFGSLNLLSLKGREISVLASLLVVTGFLAKSAQVPFYMWLPANSKAIVPALSLILAAEVGVFAFAKIFLFTFAVPQIVFDVVALISVITIIVAGALAFIETDIKRVLAYSTVAQIGYVFLGFSTASFLGFSAAVLYMIVHGFGKAGLFLSAGIIERETGTSDLSMLGGLFKTMPLVAAGFFMCALSIIGFPPFGGFFAKLLIVMSLVRSGKILFAVLAVAGAVFTLLYLFRLYNKIFLDAPSPLRIQAEAAGKPSAVKTKTMTAIVLLLGILSLAAGLFARVPLNFMELLK